MPVRKRGDAWQVDVHLGDGRRIRRQARTAKEAEILERELIAQNLHPVVKSDEPKINDITFVEFVPEYLDYCRRNKAPKTFHNESILLNAHIVPFLGKYRFSELNNQLVERYKANRQKDGMSPRTINLEMTLISVTCKMAVKWGYATSNPVRGVDRLKRPTKPPRFLSHDEVYRLSEAAKDTYAYALVMTALHTGMRKSELFNLRWTDIDFAVNTITIQSKENWHTKNYQFRVLELTDTLRKTLLAHRDVGEGSEYVFTYDGCRLTSNIANTWRRILAKSDITDCTLHTLRHTFASHLAMAGVPLTHIQQLMGHQDYQTTLIYAHLSKESLKSQVHHLTY